MNGLKRFAAIAAIATLAAIAVPAQAGRNCEPQPPRAVSVQQAMTLAERTARRLDESGAQAVALARAGQDLSRYGLRYSHFGFAYRDGGTWRVVHKLNQCGTSHAAVFRQGLGEFFLDDLYDYQAAFIVLQPEVQDKLLPVLMNNVSVARLNTPSYSMVAYPWSQRYQQSNQWAIETLAMSQDPGADTRERAQAWLQLRSYTPDTLHLNAFTRLGARMTAANVAFDDHPNEKRFSDRIETVTVDSVFRWLQRSGLGSAPQTIR